MDANKTESQDYGNTDTIQTSVGRIVAITSDGSGTAVVTFPVGWQSVQLPADGRLPGQDEGVYTLAAAVVSGQPGTYEITVADDEMPENPYTIEVVVAAAR